MGTEEPAPAVTSKSATQWVLRTNLSTDNGEAMYERPVDEPAPSVTTRGDNWKLTQKATGQNGSRSRSRSRSLDEPSLPIALGHNVGAWCWERPSTAVMGDRPVAAPGYRGGADDRSTTMMADAVRVELWELARLQDFPDDYPFQGTKTAIAQQIGNACPRGLVAAIVAKLV